MTSRLSAGGLLVAGCRVAFFELPDLAPVRRLGGVNSFPASTMARPDLPTPESPSIRTLAFAYVVVAGGVLTDAVPAADQ
jgi:hypothetical protein